MTTISDETRGELLPVSGDSLATRDKAASPAARQAGGRQEVLDGELITDAEYERSRRRGLAGQVVAKLPPGLQTRQGRSEAMKHVGGHAIMIPFRYPKATLRGLSVAGRVWWRWVRVEDFYEAAKAGDVLPTRFTEIQAHRTKRRWISTACAVCATGGLYAGLMFEGPLVVWGAALVASGALALAGRPRGGTGRKAVMGSRTLSWAMDGNHLVDAFRDAKIIGKDEGLQFVKLPVHDGRGWYTVVDLPPSRKASKAVALREELASALAVDEVRLILERVRGDEGHAGRLALWVGDSDPYAAAPVASPLADAAAWNLWSAVPFGRTARGTRVTLPVVWTSLLIGAIPRMGKTYAARIPITAAALDPFVRLILADGKGGKDFRPFELVAYRYIRNTRPDQVERLIAVLEECAADVEDRFDRLAEMDDEVCPESKVTPEITRDPKMNMPLTVIGIDEIQNYLEDGTPLNPDDKKCKKTRGQRILELLTFIAKTGPAAGYSLVLATQKPDSAVIPDKLRGQLGTRFAMKVMTWQASETIMGAGTYKAGMDASKLLTSHKGVGLLLGADGETALSAGEAITLSTDLLTIKGVRSACERGRALREQAGTLSGDAAGEFEVQGLTPEVAERIEKMSSAMDAGEEEAELVGDLPEVLALLTDVIDEAEAGVVATAELASRIGWDSKRLGEELRRAGVEAPVPSRQRINGSSNPVSVTNIDAVKAAVVAASAA